MRFLQWAHIGMGATDAVESAIKMKGPVGGPSAFYQVEIFLRPLIALGLRREVAVALLLRVRLASDNVERVSIGAGSSPLIGAQSRPLSSTV
jgi:hypothetical protein